MVMAGAETGHLRPLPPPAGQVHTPGDSGAGHVWSAGSVLRKTRAHHDAHRDDAASATFLKSRHGHAGGGAAAGDADSLSYPAMVVTQEMDGTLLWPMLFGVGAVSLLCIGKVLWRQLRRGSGRYSPMPTPSRRH